MHHVFARLDVHGVKPTRDGIRQSVIETTILVQRHQDVIIDVYRVGVGRVFVPEGEDEPHDLPWTWAEIIFTRYFRQLKGVSGSIVVTVIDVSIARPQPPELVSLPIFSHQSG
jgi:hypothetical protein